MEVLVAILAVIAGVILGAFPVMVRQMRMPWGQQQKPAAHVSGEESHVRILEFRQRSTTAWTGRR